MPAIAGAINENEPEVVCPNCVSPAFTRPSPSSLNQVKQNAPEGKLLQLNPLAASVTELPAQTASPFCFPFIVMFPSVNTASACSPELCPSAVQRNVAPSSS